MSGKVVVVVVIVLVAAVCAFRFWPSDERAIRKQLAVIEEAGSKEPAEKSIEALFKAKQIAELFSDPCRLTVASANHVGEYPRKQIQDRILMVRGFYTQAKVSLHDVTIDISPDKDRCCSRHHPPARRGQRARRWPMSMSSGPRCGPSTASGC